MEITLSVDVKKVGEVLPNGSIVIRKELIKTTDSAISKESKFLLDKIIKVNQISHSDLLRKSWRKLNAIELNENIDRLIQAELVSKTDKDGSSFYSSNAPKSLSKPLKSDFDMAKDILNDSEIEEQANRPLSISIPSVWAYKNYLLQIISDEYLNDEEAILYIKSYVLDHERGIEEMRNKIKTLVQILENGEFGKRENIPEHVRMYVWRRDGGKCADCGSIRKLEFDHVIPISKGGSNTVRNVRILCEKCNRNKSNKI